jgi:hypothetical protein
VPRSFATAPTVFRFATEDGTLVGWDPAVNDRLFAGGWGFDR